MRSLELVLLLTSAWAAAAATYYVSPAGNDDHDGLGAESGRALLTIQAGVDKLQPGDTLLVRGGVYREMVTFPRSGLPGQPITVSAYRDEQVVITGCEPVRGWTRESGNVWKAPMPWTLGTGRNQVFADGEVLVEARFPNKPSPGLEMYVADLSPLWPTFGPFSIPDPVKHPGRIVSKLLDGQPDDYWKGALYYGVHYQGWCAQTGVITHSRSGEIEVADRTKTWWFGPAYGGRYKPEEGRGMIVGHRHALDAPGEWVWEDGTLYLVPGGSGPPRNIEAKRRQLAVDLSGRSHIHLEGLNVFASSMRLDGSVACAIDRCNLRYISHYTRQYAIGQVEHERNTITSGETGIYLSGRDNVFTNCSIRFSAGAGFHLRGYHQTIHNCLIDEVSYCSHYLNPITDAVSDFPAWEDHLVGGHVITFNTMRNAGRHMFNFHGNGTSLRSRDRAPMDYMATLFAHNHLYNGMLQTKDAGMLTGYYCSGGTLNGLNSQVVYNVMHDSWDIFAMRIHKLGIVYLDAGTCDVDLHHNLLWAAPGSLQRGLWFNTMCVDINARDNVFHEQFERTCADLRPADFPRGKPFRFGCDFDDPPPVPTWPQLDRLTLKPKAGPALMRLTDGASLSLGVVDWDAGWQSVTVHMASGAKQMNTDTSARTRPRHRHATDPLVLEATVRDGASPRVRTQWSFVYNVTDGAWLRFDKVPLGEGYRRFRAVYGNEQQTARSLEVRLDAVNGPVVCTLDLPQTDHPRGGRVQIYGEAVGAVAPAARGTRDLFIVFRSDDGKPVGEFEYFRFEQARSHVPLQKNEVRLELRLNSPAGEKVGEVHPHFTGGETAFRDFVGHLEPVRGKHALFVVVDSNITEPAGVIDRMSLEKAHHPIDWDGIGAPPRRRNGKWIFPPATNLPQARPANRYPPPGVTVKAGPRPLARARWMKSPPHIDGDVSEWSAVGQPIRLTESWDRTPSAAPASEAWFGYDGEALYIAARHEVTGAGGLRIAGHRWGATDAMEVAIQTSHADHGAPILNWYGWPDGRVISTDQAGAPANIVRELQRATRYNARVEGGAWTCEWRIPFSAMGFTPATTPLLPLNLGVRKTEQNAWVIWRGTGAATYVVDRAGLLVLENAPRLRRLPQRADLVAWFDAADPETVETDDRGRVSRWRDKSPRGGDAVQENPDHRPTYTVTGIGDHPCLQFDERQRTRLEVPDLADDRISCTVFAVFTNPRPGSEVNHDQRLFTASDGKGYDYQVGIAATIPGMQTGGPRQSVHLFRDRWARHVRIGCFSPNVQTFFTGGLGEVLVYSRILHEDEQDLVRAYLMLKWGLD